MATLDILSPLAGDTISADNVHVMVAYNFQSHFRAIVRINCQFAGASTHTDVDSATPGTVDFSLGTVSTGDQTVRVWCTSPDLEDYEYPIHVGIAAGDPQIGVDAPPPPPPPGPPMAGPGHRRAGHAGSAQGDGDASEPRN